MNSEGLLLIGARAAGKTTLGRLLAMRLGLPFWDSDTRIEEESERSIAALMGEGSFRQWEARVLTSLLGAGPSVIASGGGAVLWEGLAEAACGWTCLWLDAAPEVLAARIASDAGARPSLTGRPPCEESAEVRVERLPRYEALATLRFDTGRLTLEHSLAILQKDPRVARHSRRAITD